MIYSDSFGKIELYSKLYENSLIGSEVDTAWDHHQPPSEPPPPRALPPFCANKYFGPAPPHFDPDAHVYDWYSKHHEMGKKRTHEGHELQELAPAPPRSPADSAMTDGKAGGSDATTSEVSISIEDPQTRAVKSPTEPPAPANTPESAAPAQQHIAEGAASQTLPANGAPAGTQPPANGAAVGPLPPANGAPAGSLPPLRMQPAPLSSCQLLYHCLHHVNIVTALLSAYLSQDALIRDLCNARFDPMGLPFEHRSVTHTLLSANTDLQACKGVLERSEKIEEFRKKGCFHTLCNAMEILHATALIVRTPYMQNMLPLTAQIGSIKEAWERIMRLREGTEDAEAWSLCWDMVLNRT